MLFRPSSDFVSSGYRGHTPNSLTAGSNHYQGASTSRSGFTPIPGSRSLSVRLESDTYHDDDDPDHLDADVDLVERVANSCSVSTDMAVYHSETAGALFPSLPYGVAFTS